MIPTYCSLLNLFIIGNNEKEEQVQENKTKHEWKSFIACVHLNFLKLSFLLMGELA